MSKIARQEQEISKLYDRLQEAHEDRDRYKKALEEIAASDGHESAEDLRETAQEALK